jgi:uncharacterized protein YlzI (FlbEa/FlbD family)
VRLRVLHDLVGHEVIVNIDAVEWLKSGERGTTLAFSSGKFVVRETPEEIRKLIPSDW